MNNSFAERRATIVAAIKKGIEDLSNLNNEISETISANNEAINSLRAENNELTSMSALNKTNIKALSSLK